MVPHVGTIAENETHKGWCSQRYFRLHGGEGSLIRHLPGRRKVERALWRGERRMVRVDTGQGLVRREGIG